MTKIATLFTILTLTLHSATFNVATTPELRTALETSATNGEDDTIVLADGTYKTTDDGGGTFVYDSYQDNNLILQGSSYNNVILDGDSTNQVLNFDDYDSQTISNISIINGLNMGKGGGFYTNGTITINDCNISNNSSSDIGGGFYTSGGVTINKTFITNNTALSMGGGLFFYGGVIKDSVISNNKSSENGGGIYSGNPLTISYSTVSNNSASSQGGGIFMHYDSINVNDCNFTQNSAGDGGGIYMEQINSDTVTMAIQNSNFLENTVTSDGGGIYSEGTTNLLSTNFISNIAKSSGAGIYSSGIVEIYNGIFYNNQSIDSGGGLRASYDTVMITNTFFISNSSAVYSRANQMVYNSVFYDNSSKDIAGSSDTLLVKNSYIDEANMVANNKEFSDIYEITSEIEFTIDIDSNFSITNSALLLDKGTSNISLFMTLPDKDINGEDRLKGSTIDIGPYEFDTNEVEITLSFNQMSDEQKLIKAIDPIYYTDIIAIIDAEKLSANASGHTVGVYDGKQYVQDNLAEFSLVTLANMEQAISDTNISATTSGIATGKAYVTANPSEFSLMTQTASDAAATTATAAGKQYVQDNLSEFDLISKPSIEVTPSTVSTLDTGWTLASTPFEITDLTVFDAAEIVWIYNGETLSWSAYSSDATMAQAIADAATINTITSIPASSGVWVKK